MRLKALLLVPLVTAGGLVPAALITSARAEVVCEAPAPAPLSFNDPVFIDTEKAGGEPVSIVAQDGSISVSAHAGTTHAFKDASAVGGAGDFVVGYTNQTLNWRSIDGGKSWRFVGLAGQPVGPHTATSTGFSDPDYAMDDGGRIYNTEIDLANVAVFSSADDGQNYNRGFAEVTSGDRPWLTGGAKDEAYLYVNTGQQIWRTADGGLTWTLQSNGRGPTSKMLRDPLNKATGLLGPSGTQGIAISADQGKTWATHGGAGLGRNTDFFGMAAVDAKGTVYKAAAGGYSGSSDTTPNGEVTFNYFDRATKSWGNGNEAVTIPTPEGDALWPWIIAGDDGRTAVTWLQSLKGKPTEFYVYVAYTENAHGSTVTCSDGSTGYAPPRFSVANASGRPIHKGPICLSGTTCNASLGTTGDRRLGDFISVNFDKDGKLFVASADTTLPNSIDGKTKVVGNPIFIGQKTGGSMLEKPMVTRPTRVPCLTPNC